MRVAPGKIDQIGSESHHNDPKTTLSRANKFRGPYSVGSFARGSVANHFPWDSRLRPELTPDWHNLGNAPNIDEYIRRQGMTAHDYGALLERLKRDFPTESFLIVRYGDHQPEFGYRIIDPTLNE